jgi:hypothetical protein
MHKRIVAFALSTSALAFTSIYLWTELRDARSQLELLRRPSTAMQIPMPRALATQPRHSTDPSASAPTLQTGSQATTTSSPSDDSKARQILVEEEFRDGTRRVLAQLSDPTMRAQMFEEWKEANLSNKAKYARYLGISESSAERLIDVLADQYLAKSEAYARCTLQPPCDYEAVARETSAAQQLAITDLLGAEKQQRFEQYTYTNIERQMVSHFLRDKIPAGSELSAQESERFISALADERRLVEMEIKQRGLEPFSYPMEGVAFTFPSKPFQPGNSSERLNEAADFNRRIHARAEAILTPSQLAAFEQMQETAIVGVKHWLRQQERDLVTRTATSGESR